MIPLSTCVSDPKWFHANQGNSFVYKDKNGVYCGLRADPLVPGPLCEGACGGPDVCKTKDPAQCEFLKIYNIQLHLLDFNNILNRIKRIASIVKEREALIGEPDIVLLVYETPDNPCSERSVLKKWFKENGIELKEWHKKI